MYDTTHCTHNQEKMSAFLTEWLHKKGWRAVFFWSAQLYPVMLDDSPGTWDTSRQFCDLTTKHPLLLQHLILLLFFSFACTFILSSSHSFRFSRFQAIDIRLGFFRIILFSLSSFLNAYVLVYWYISFATLPSSSSSLSSTSLSSFVSFLPIQCFNRLPSSPFTV